MPSLEEIPVFHCFARSGGTLLNQCLGVSPGNLVLSETNPCLSCRPIEQQAREWLGLLTVDEGREFTLWPYAHQIRFLHERARTHRQQLILRDWSTVNFLPHTASAEIEPSGVLEQPIYLAFAGLKPRAIVLTRRAGTVYTSIRENFLRLKQLELETFAVAYLTYARSVAALPRFKLEDFTAAPGAVMPAIAAALGVALVPDFQKHYRSFHNCTGNNLLRPHPVSAQAESINPLVEKRCQPVNARWPDHPALCEADALFGYAT